MFALCVMWLSYRDHVHTPKDVSPVDKSLSFRHLVKGFFLEGLNMQILTTRVLHVTCLSDYKGNSALTT